MVRTNIYLTPRQLSRLRKEAGNSGLSVAEIVRRAIDEFHENREAKKEGA